MKAKRRILIVDDNQDILSCLKQYYSQYYDTIAFNDSKVALEWLLKNYRNVDIISTDYQMPNLNGINFVRMVRQFTDVPILMVTGDTQNEDVRKLAPLAGVTHLLSKTDADGIKKAAEQYATLEVS